MFKKIIFSCILLLTFSSAFSQQNITILRNNIGVSITPSVPYIVLPKKYSYIISFNILNNSQKTLKDLSLIVATSTTNLIKISRINEGYNYCIDGQDLGPAHSGRAGCVLYEKITTFDRYGKTTEKPKVCLFNKTVCVSDKEIKITVF